MNTFYKPLEEKIYPIHCERCEKDLKEKWKSEKELEDKKENENNATKGISIGITIGSLIMFLSFNIWGGEWIIGVLPGLRKKGA